MAKYVVDNKPSPIDFESIQKGTTARILQNCKNLLRCHMGEAPYDRMRGINPVVYDLPIAELNNVLLSEVDRVLEWEPKARAVSAKASMEGNGQLVLTVIVDIPD